MIMNRHHMHMQTDRLILVPVSFEFASKILNHDIHVYEEYGITQTDEWPGGDIMDILPAVRDNLSSVPLPDGFGPWLFIEKRENFIIGDGGFKGSPNVHGEIDLGFSIIGSKRRRGYACEAASALVKWGLSQSNVTAITADCLIANIASRNLLMKLGMTKVRQDEEMIYFESYPSA